MDCSSHLTEEQVLKFAVPDDAIFSAECSECGETYWLGVCRKCILSQQSNGTWTVLLRCPRHDGRDEGDLG